MSIFIGTLISEVLYGVNDRIPQIHCITDCMSLMEALKSQKFVTEKRLRIEISSLKELVEKNQIQCDGVIAKIN